MTVDNRSGAWEDSYGRRENFTFVASDELVRFASRFLRQRTGLDSFIDKHGTAGSRVADFGCGIGRSLIFGNQMEFDMYGLDLSETAIGIAREWLQRSGQSTAILQHVVQGDIRNIPWPDGHIEHGWSDGALDSMSREITNEGVAEIARVIQTGGYFYCNLISGDRIGKETGFSGDEVVATKHEQDTIQSYYNEQAIRDLFDPYFTFVQFYILEHRSVVADEYHGRWHVVLQRK